MSIKRPEVVSTEKVAPALKTGDFKNQHIFEPAKHAAQSRVSLALVLTLVVMVAEVFGGYLYSSMALLADGWHMSSHALALGLTLLAYIAAKKLASSNRFNFGTWKIEILAAYSSALLLLLVAAWMLFQSIERFFSPVPIRYDEAIEIALTGLAINLVCAWLLNLKDAHGATQRHAGQALHHGHRHGQNHGHSRCTSRLKLAACKFSL